MSTINQQLGLKPRTRARAATHSGGLVSGLVCPACGLRHVVEHLIRVPETGRRELRCLCGFCSHLWNRGAA